MPPTIDFIGIGAAKSASTWLYTCLIEHPQISGPVEKELKFFDNPHQVRRGRDYYLSRFPHTKPNTINGEFSPGYMPSRAAADHIAEWFPHVKLIAILRNPIDKVYSTYWSNKIGGRGSLIPFDTFEDAIKNVPDMIENAMYGKQLQYYFSKFPKENIYVALYDELKNDPLALVQGFYRFLRVDDNFIPPSLQQGVNQTGDKRIKYPRLFKIIYRIHWKTKHLPILRSLRILIDTQKISIALQRWGVGRGNEKIEKPPMDEATRQQLCEVFAEDIKLLETIIQKDLSDWR